MHCISNTLSGNAGTTSSQTRLRVSRIEWTLDFFLPESHKNDLSYPECIHWSLSMPHDSPKTKFELVATRNYLCLHVKNAAYSAETGAPKALCLLYLANHFNMCENLYSFTVAIIYFDKESCIFCILLNHMELLIPFLSFLTCNNCSFIVRCKV